MMQSHYPIPPRWLFPITGLMPLAVVAAVAFATRMSALIAIVAFVAMMVAMASAGVFVMSWHPPAAGSRWRSTFVLFIDKLEPNPLQRWCVPVIASAVAGALGEVARTVVVFSSLGAPLSGDPLLTSAAVGVVEGLLIALAYGAGFGLVGFIRVPLERAT